MEISINFLNKDDNLNNNSSHNINDPNKKFSNSSQESQISNVLKINQNNFLENFSIESKYINPDNSSKEKRNFLFEISNPSNESESLTVCRNNQSDCLNSIQEIFSIKSEDSTESKTSKYYKYNPI